MNRFCVEICYTDHQIVSNPSLSLHIDANSLFSIILRSFSKSMLLSLSGGCQVFLSMFQLVWNIYISLLITSFVLWMVLFKRQVLISGNVNEQIFDLTSERNPR